MAEVVKLLSMTVESPIMIDSTELDVIKAALEHIPGRAIVNSINMENGRTRIDSVLPVVKANGAAVVALTIDESGMAKTAARKLEIARRIHGIATTEYGLAPEDLIFDALTFTLATGEAEWLDSAHETIEGIKQIKRELPGVFTSLGVSNVSFGLDPHARAVLNSVFLHHCVTAGLELRVSAKPRRDSSSGCFIWLNDSGDAWRDEDACFGRRPALQSHRIVVIPPGWIRTRLRLFIPYLAA